MGIYDRTAKRMSKTAGLRWVLSKVLTPLDMRFKGTRFAPSTLGMDVPLCYLTTTGRKSGELRTVPLLYATAGDGSPAVAATNFGQQRHPAWALNLVSNPHATLELDGEIRDVTAVRVSPAKAAELWPLFDGIWPGYEKYREIAPRDIMLFVFRIDD